MKTNNRAALLAFASAALYITSVAAPAFAGPPQKHKPAKKSVSNTSLATRGKALYAGNGCKNCHAINGLGGKTGPDLSSEGAKAGRTVAWLAAEVKNPKSHNPKSTMPAFDAKIKGNDLTAIASYLKTLKKATAKTTGKK